jgi:ATP-binding protein involved in chromosome partitioning
MKLHTNLSKNLYQFVRFSSTRSVSEQTSSFTANIPHLRPQKIKFSGAKYIIAVGSGKGGVGKSTVSVNLAIGLQQLGYKVGLLDADVYGPSIPKMMNLNKKPLLSDKNMMIPLENYGVRCMSIGFLVDSEAVLVWRGLMV